jgi:ribosome-associated protein
MGIEIKEGLEISESELELLASRSSGPGGQHVNKTSTRIMLRFDVVHSPSLSDDARARILARLKTRISGEGILQVISQKHRSQDANRREAVERFVELLRAALAERRPRRPTRATRQSQEKRIGAKKARSVIKRGRTPPADE